MNLNKSLLSLSICASLIASFSGCSKNAPVQNNGGINIVCKTQKCLNAKNLQIKTSKPIQLSENRTVLHNGMAYKTVKSPYTSKLWLDRNLGALRVCQSFNDEKCYGDYYQWGRGADGHEKANSSIAKTFSYEPQHSNFVISKNRDKITMKILREMKSRKKSNIWQGLNGKNNPCPSGFRVPTIDELIAETLHQDMKNDEDLFNSFLKLPNAGYRDMDKAIVRSNGVGRIWSSTTKGGYKKRAKTIRYDKRMLHISHSNHLSGIPIRCIQN